MAIVLAWETGFVMTEQLPCLFLNARSITPENDVGMGLYMTRKESGLKWPSGLASAPAHTL